jgi:Tfp pilus assembly protein PilN
LKADAHRDTLLRRMNLIRAIDEDRFIWPHVLDEVSRALPPYTWLSSLAFMGTPQGSVNVAAGAKPDASAGDDKTKKKAKKVDIEVPRDEVRIRMIGLTPDIQALTRFMRQLESSPFFADVQLNNSQLASDQGKDVTQFTLDVTYTRPDTSMIRRVPLSVSVK